MRNGCADLSARRPAAATDRPNDFVSLARFGGAWDGIRRSIVRPSFEPHCPIRGLATISLRSRNKNEQQEQEQQQLNCCCPPPAARRLRGPPLLRLGRALGPRPSSSAAVTRFSGKELPVLNVKASPKWGIFRFEGQSYTFELRLVPNCCFCVWPRRRLWG